MSKKSYEELEYERRWDEIRKLQLRPIELKGHHLPGEFKNALLTTGNNFSALKGVPNKVLARAVERLQKMIKSGSTVPIYNRHFYGIENIVGLVQAIRMQGDQVYFDGRFLCSEKAQEIAAIPNKVFCMFGEYKFSKTKDTEIIDVKILSVGVYPKVELIH